MLGTAYKTPAGLPTPETFGFSDYKGAIDGLGTSPVPTDFSADRQRVEQALFDRMQPQLDKQRAALETQLVNQGFTRGTEAFQNEMDARSRAENDARLAAIAQGGAEQANLFNMALAGRQQGLTEALTPYNMARQDFGNTMNLRQQLINEALQERNQPLNELSALMSGSQVQNPTFQNTPNVQMAGTDIAGLTQQNYANQMQQYQSQMQQQNAMLGGLFGLAGTIGGAAIGGPFGAKIGSAMGGWASGR